MASVIQMDLNKILVGTPFEKERIIGVALSGGRDSIALCHALKHAGESIVAINVEHGIRGEASLRDSDFVKEFCKKEGITLYSYSVDAPTFAKENGYTLEQAARILRYAIFDKAVGEGKCDLVALAHHSGDQAETILMHVLRGTGIAGLVGMKKLSGKYIRPLLDYSREDIDAYVQANNLEYVDDETNEDSTYTRNFLRAELSKLKEKYPDLENSFMRLSRTAFETEEYLQSILPNVEVENGEVLISDCDNPFVLKRLVLNAAKALGVSQDIEEKHLEAVVLLASNENGKRLNLTHGLTAFKDSRGIVLVRDENAEYGEEVPFGVGRFEAFGVQVEIVKSVSEAELKSGVSLYCDMDKLPKGCVLRYRHDGDFIRKFGGGTKSLGDFLTDKKVPARKRDGLVVVAKDSEIFAVLCVDISREVKVDENTKNIVKLSLI